MKSATETLLLQLKTLSDATRMRLVALCRHGECSVSELTGVVGLSQPRVSQHLKQLCDAGLLERFRDGQRMYYRMPAHHDVQSDRLLRLVPDDEAMFSADLTRLRRLRGESTERPTLSAEQASVDRAIYREIVELTVTRPLGELLDVGCGRGKLLKLLASRAHRAVGVDIDADARQLARAELMLAGIPNCSLRKGDMYRLPFVDGEFDTIILDDVLVGAKRPVRALKEAARLLKPGGRLLVLQAVTPRLVADVQQAIARFSAAAHLRLAPSRLAPTKRPAWLLAVASPADGDLAAA